MRYRPVEDTITSALFPGKASLCENLLRHVLDQPGRVDVRFCRQNDISGCVALARDVIDLPEHWKSASAAQHAAEEPA